MMALRDFKATAELHLIHKHKQIYFIHIFQNTFTNPHRHCHLIQVSKLTKPDKVQRSICESEVHVLSRVIDVQWVALYVSTPILLEPRDRLLVSILQDALVFSENMLPHKNGARGQEQRIYCIFQYT